MKLSCCCCSYNKRLDVWRRLGAVRERRKESMQKGLCKRLDMRGLTGRSWSACRCQPGDAVVTAKASEGRRLVLELKGVAVV